MAAVRGRGLRALSRAGSLLRASAPPQTALGSLLRARALPTIHHKSHYSAEAQSSSAPPIYSGSGSISSGSRNLPKGGQNATGTGGRFPCGGSGRGYGVMVTAASLSALVASVLNPEVAECQEDDTLPDSVDWTKRGAVTSVKNQYGSDDFDFCGNCWAHSTVASIESLHQIKTGILLDLSVQQVTDCAPPPCYGCYGGSSYVALEYEVSAGLSLESTYPSRLDHWHGFCRWDVVQPAVRIESFDVTDCSEEDLMRAVAKQPVVVVIQLEVNVDRLKEYTGGIMEYKDLPTVFGPDVGLHSVLIVGYGVDEATGIPFSKIKNSYGPDWGENGYFRIRRNDPHGLGVGGIRARPGLYPLYENKDKKSNTNGRKTHLEEIVVKQFNPIL